MPHKEKNSLSMNVFQKTEFYRINNKRNPEKRARLFKTFVEERLNRVDVFGLVELVEVAVAAKTENKPEVDQILNAVSNYLTRIDEPILKKLTNSGEKTGQNTNMTKLRQAIEAINTIIDQMNNKKKNEMFGEKNTHILRFIDDIGHHIRQITTDDEGAWSLIPINGYGRNDVEKISRLLLSPIKKVELEEKVRLFDEGITDKERLLSAVLSLMKKLNKDNMIYELAHLPTYIIEKLQDVTEPNMYWDKSYGGISLKQIFSETDPDIQKSNFLTFLKYVPRGDIFWQTILEDGLLGDFAVVDEDGIHKTGNTATILSFQYSIGTDLFINRPSNSQEIADILTAFYELKIPIKSLLNTLESSLYFYITYILENEEILPEESLREFLKEKNDPPAILIDELVDWYLKRNINKIQAYLVQNAPSEQVKNDVRQWAIEKKRFDYTEAHTKEILASIRYIMGDPLWNMLFENSEKQTETEKVTDNIVNSVLECKLWPTEEIDRDEKFDKGSLPYMLGVDNIKFRFDPTHPNIMAAAIQLRVPRSIAVIASIQNIDNKLDISFSIDPKENKEILQLLKLLVAVELADNLSDIKLQSNIKIKKPTPEKSFDEVSSRQLTERLNDHAKNQDKEFKPRTVKCHQRHLGGATNYINAVKAYQQFVSQHDIDHLSPDEVTVYGSIIADLKITLEDMDIISERKEQLISSLSDEVREKMKLVVDPIDGKERWIHTWVISYVSPAPDPSIANNLEKYYTTYIKDGEGPRSEIYSPILVHISKEPDNT